MRERERPDLGRPAVVEKERERETGRPRCGREDAMASTYEEATGHSVEHVTDYVESELYRSDRNKVRHQPLHIKAFSTTGTSIHSFWGVRNYMLVRMKPRNRDRPIE